MEIETVSSIFKLTAILVIFLGLILFSVVFLQIQSMNSMFQGMSGQNEMFSSAFSNVSRLGYTTPIVVTIWGILLFLLNQPLALLVAKN